MRNRWRAAYTHTHAHTNGTFGDCSDGAWQVLAGGTDAEVLLLLLLLHALLLLLRRRRLRLQLLQMQLKRDFGEVRNAGLHLLHFLRVFLNHDGVGGGRHQRFVQRGHRAHHLRMEGVS